MATGVVSADRGLPNETVIYFSWVMKLARFFTQQEHIQLAHDGKGHGGAERQARRHHTNVDPGAAIEATHQPEHDLLRHLVVDSVG